MALAEGVLRTRYGGDDSDLRGVWRAAEEPTVVSRQIPWGRAVRRRTRELPLLSSTGLLADP